jgi:hypothetical protein
MKRIPGMQVCLFVSLGLWGPGCLAPKRSAEPAPAGDRLARLDDGRYFGEPCHRENLTVWPILSENPLDPGDFLNLREAQDRGLAVVREVGSGAGAATSNQTEAAGPEGQPAAGSDSRSPSVNQLVIENKGELPLLVCGGTVVKGGNQDRQIARDFVIAPRTEVPVDVFCVEKGRWQGVRNGSPTLALLETEDVVAASSVSFSAGYDSDQEEVWKSVEGFNLRAGKAPPTGTLLASFEEVEPAVAAQREDARSAIREHFQALGRAGKPPVGFAYALDGKPVMVRAFASPKLFEGQFEAFLKSMCLEDEVASGPELALRSAPPGRTRGSCAPASLMDVLELVRSINQAPEEIATTSAANRRGLRRCERGGNLNCYLERPPRGGGVPAGELVLVPLSQEWTAAPEKP